MATGTTSKRIAPPKRLLYGPGPTMVDPRVYEALSQPVVGLRDPYFLEVMHDIQAGLREVFGTANEQMYLVPASGSGAMETAVANFVYPGSKFLIFSAGVFAERMAAMAVRQQAKVVRVERPWGEVFSEADAAEAIEKERPDVVAFVQAETSTGAFQSGRAIAPHARNSGALVLADCITTLGAMPVELDSVGIDVAFSCSQKGLSCPAGLSPLTFSKRAAEKLEQRPEPPSSWYFDLSLMGNYFNPPHTYQHTPSPPLYYALHQGLAVIGEEGLPNRWERHKRAGERLVRGLETLGFSPVIADPTQRIWHLTTVTPPNGVDEAKLRETLLRNHGIEISSGLGKFAGKILRIGTMGPLATNERVDNLLEAVQASL